MASYFTARWVSTLGMPHGPRGITSSGEIKVPPIKPLFSCCMSILSMISNEFITTLEGGNVLEAQK